ncbi:MAG: patatin-like phospholipase family protein [Elusimicrobia bacterium]|nr:patatin-like phospholipase family protein [Elusimicrobiota bacterium]
MNREKRPLTALILAGGAARGAYEAGVVPYILEDVARELGRDPPIDIFCGTSVGAVNACILASLAHEPARARAQRLVETWTKLRFSDVVRVNIREALGPVRGFFGLRRGQADATAHPGGLIDPAGLERIIRGSISFAAIRENLAKGRFQGLSLSTTHVATGRTIVFVEAAEGRAPKWGSDSTIVSRPVRIRAKHVLASAAVPALFPPVDIGGDWFCDGGLRQNVPLSPARRMGADRLLVVIPRNIAPVKPPAAQRPNLFLMLGKALNAMLLDRLDNDIDRLARINSILDAGARRFGPDFAEQLNEELGYPKGGGLRPLDVVSVRASQNIGRLAGDFVRSQTFQSRAPGWLGRILRRLAQAGADRESDLISYLLFDGDFARQLIELGRLDARAKHDQLCAFFVPG